MSFRGSYKAFCLLRSPTPTELNKSCIYSYPLVTSQSAWPACDVPGSHVTIVWPQCNAASCRKREIERSGDQLDCRLLVTYAGSPSCVWFASRVEQVRSPPWLWPRLVLIRREWKYSKETLIVHALTQNSCPDIYPSIIKKPRCLGSWWMYSVKQIWVHVLVDVWYGYVVSGGNKRVIIVNSFH